MNKACISFVVFVGFGLFGSALACNTVGLAHLNVSEIDQITVYFDHGRATQKYTEKSSLDLIVNFAQTLSGTWARTATKAPPITGSLTFWNENQIQEFIAITSDSLLRGGCLYTLSDGEKAQLVVMFHLGREAFGF